MQPILLPPVVRWWHCPSCEKVDRTEQHGPHTQFHECQALGNVNIPLVEVPNADTKADGRQVLVEREDYIGKEMAGPISAVRTERGDGSNDCTVFAPTAALRIS